MAKELRELRFYGQKDKYVMGDKSGMNSRMDEIQCAILLHKLGDGNVIEEIFLRRWIRCFYDEQLKGVIKTLDWQPMDAPHLYPVFPECRKSFVENMIKCGVETAIHYPFTLPEAVGKMYNTHPNAKWFSRHCVSIPFHTHITNDIAECVISAIKESV
jgi:dTDP-4-amino-4,6-dideoxygalactose transaminase